MQLSGLPIRLPLIWAANAAAGQVRDIPTPSQIPTEDGAASLNDGFPPLCLTPELSGGVPPFGQDMNGILKWVTGICQWFQAGGPSTYDATFSTAVGGYPNGAVLQSASTAGRFWRSITDNNTQNPDAPGQTQWVDFFAPVYVSPTITGTFTAAGPAVLQQTLAVSGAASFTSTVALGASATAATRSAGDSTTALANTAFVTGAVATLNTSLTNWVSANFLTIGSAAATYATVSYVNGTFATVSYVNGTFATPSYVNSQAAAAQTNAEAYTDGKFAFNGAGQMYLGGFYLNWGSFTAVAGGSGSIGFTPAFPNTCLGVICQPTGNPGTNNSFAAAVVDRTSFNWNWASTAGGSATTYYLAWGY